MKSSTATFLSILVLIGCYILALNFYSPPHSKNQEGPLSSEVSYGKENVTSNKQPETQTANTNTSSNPSSKNTTGVDGVENSTPETTIDESDESDDSINQLEKAIQEIAELKANNDDAVINDISTVTDLLEQNPYKKLGVYETMPQRYYNTNPASGLKDSNYYGIIRNTQYCQEVDLLNLINPQNMFGQVNFVTDYDGDESLIREDVMPQFGSDVFPELSIFMPMKHYSMDLHDLPINATMFVLKRVNLHEFYEPNKQLICLSQMYNHIPGNGVLTRKDLVVDSIKDYMIKYEKKPHCVEEANFPHVYRLNREDECKQFFAEINSPEYQNLKKTEPIPYLLKVGFGAHRAAGVFLFNEDMEPRAKKQYQNGAQCGVLDDSLLAQKYISNPLLLDKQNKFDFRIYMLVASVKPLIVYYHDGFLRLSLSKYDKFSKEKNVHLTNTHLSKEIFAQANENKDYQGMTEDELRDYQMWMMEDLQNFLLKEGKITDPNWLENELKPKFKRSFVHIMRMVEDSLYKSSSVFELFGLDFVMDENLNIWFIESNASPQLVGTNDRKTEFLVKMLSDMFELQQAYLKSRMRRVFKFLKEMKEEVKANPEVDYGKLKEEFDRVNINKLDSDVQISENNSFVKIMDKNIEGPGAYFGHISQGCVEFD